MVLYSDIYILVCKRGLTGHTTPTVRAICKFAVFQFRSLDLFCRFTLAGFVHFFVNRIQDFFQTFSRPFFLFSRLKITVKFFMAREEIIVLIMKTTNKKRKKTVSAV